MPSFRLKISTDNWITLLASNQSNTRYRGSADQLNTIVRYWWWVLLPVVIYILLVWLFCSAELTAHKFGQWSVAPDGEPIAVIVLILCFKLAYAWGQHWLYFVSYIGNNRPTTQRPVQTLNSGVCVVNFVLHTTNKCMKLDVPWTRRMGMLCFFPFFLIGFRVVSQILG